MLFNSHHTSKMIIYFGGTRMHNLHISVCDALPVELPSPWEQGGGEYGTYTYKCFLREPCIFL